jgi:hypothetical protein
MTHDDEKPPVNPDSLKVGYEVGEMGLKVILAFGLLISALVIVSMIVMLFFLGALGRYAPPVSQYVPSPLAGEAEVAPVMETPLEIEPVLDRLALEEEALMELEEYGWISEEAGIARIPIAEAMRLVAEHGLPVLAPLDAALGPADVSDEE